VILAEPAPSQGDVHFRIFGIPVRVHPFFWVISLLIGLQGDPLPVKVLLWVASMVVSILIHELGHALIQRHFGGRPRIVLHGMGGLAICGDCDRSTRSQILISLAGPGAGFALALLIFVVVRAAGHQIGCLWSDKIPFEALGLEAVNRLNLAGTTFYWEPFQSKNVDRMVGSLLQINILWGAVNLLPIYPLDGGQVARELCLLGNPRTGIILSLRISMIAAIAMVLVGLSSESLYVAIMFGYFAYSSYKTLDAYRASLW
jgi:stage IV sporulation protein FB